MTATPMPVPSKPHRCHATGALTCFCAVVESRSTAERTIGGDVSNIGITRQRGEGRNRYGIMSSHDGVQFRLQHSALVLYLLMMHISGHLVELNDDVNGWAIGAVFESFKVVGQLVFFSVSKGDADRKQANCNRQQHPSAPRSGVEHLRMDEVLFSLEPRSEEHTSELQSRLHLVCRLLL